MWLNELNSHKFSTSLLFLKLKRNKKFSCSRFNLSATLKNVNQIFHLFKQIFTKNSFWNCWDENTIISFFYIFCMEVSDNFWIETYRWSLTFRNQTYLTILWFTKRLYWTLQNWANRRFLKFQIKHTNGFLRLN